MSAIYAVYREALYAARLDGLGALRAAARAAAVTVALIRGARRAGLPLYTYATGDFDAND